MLTNNKYSAWLSSKNDFFLTLWAGIGAFMCYFSMYAFRKPFTVGTFDGQAFWGIDYKILLVSAQVLGYMCSKFWGIKWIAELKPNNRPLSILTLIGFAELSLVFFALVPPPYNMVFLFLNGLPLGLIWGIVFSFLEGRRTTEVMGVALAVSFIVSSGVVKTCGKFLIEQFGVSDFLMPALTGALFIVPLLISVFMLAQIPPPSVSDELARTKRQPMDREERRHLIQKYAFGFVCLIVFYLLLTALRDFRDNFIVELWRDLGITDAQIFTSAELPIAFSVFFIVGSTILIKNNARALWTQHALILVGCVCIFGGVYGFQNQWLSPVSMMILVGFGIYLAYILFQSLIFERFFATFREIGNVGFLMYIADATGYLGSIAVMFFRNFGAKNLSWLSFFLQASYGVAVAGVVLVMLSGRYFYVKLKNN